MASAALHIDFEVSSYKTKGNHENETSIGYSCRGDDVGPVYSSDRLRDYLGSNSQQNIVRDGRSAQGPDNDPAALR